MQTYAVHESNGGVRDCGTFYLDWVGKYAPDSMDVTWDDRPREIEPEMRELIERTWQAELASARNADRILFDAPLCRLIDCEVASGRLSLTLGRTSYREFLATNLRNPNARYTHGPDALADAVGVSAAVLCRDHFLLMGRRSERVAFHAGLIHPIGGMMHPPEQGGRPDPFAAMAAELSEELNLPPETGRLRCLGLVRDRKIVQPELIFQAPVDVDVSELRKKAADARDAREHVELVPVRNCPSAVVQFMETNIGKMSPLSLAMLLLHGLDQWGTGWFTSTRGYLSRVI